MNRIVHRLKQMPEGLKLCCIALGTGGPLIVLMMILPIGQCWIDGQPVSHLEFWKSGSGPMLTAAGCVMAVFAAGIYRARRWVRLAIPAIFLTCTAGALAYAMFHPYHETWADAASGAVWTLISWWYLNRKRTVVGYFATGGG